MESIAVTKPNITVARQDVLSPFGLLTELFLQEIARRNNRSPGFYRPVSLAFLEESEREALPSPPEIHVDFDIDLFLNRLRKEAQEREKNEKKPQTPQERIIERVIVRERELRTAYAETRRVVIETGGKRYIATAPVKASEPIPAQAKHGVGADRETLRIKEIGDPGSADLPRRADSPSKLLTAVGTAKPVRTRTATESKLADRTLPLASRMMGAPAAGGWTPQQREMHPGYPVRSETKQAGNASFGSILLPDVLRRRREEAIAQSENPRAVVNVPEDYGAFEDALAWSTEGTEQISETERVLREVRRAVDETLRRNALREEQAFGKPDRRGERETIPTRKESAESQNGSGDFLTRARAHAYEAQKTEPAPTQGDQTSGSASETARKAASAAAADNAEIHPAASDRKTAAASEPAFRQPVIRTETAARETDAAIAAVPTGAEPDLSAELTYREEAERPEDASAEQRDLKQHARQTAVGVEATNPAQPETAAHEAIPSADVKTGEIAELTFRDEPEKQTFEITALRDTIQPAPQTVIGTETAEAAQPGAERASSNAIPSADSKTAFSAELTYREGSDQPGMRRKTTEQEAEASVAAIPSANAETGKTAELTFRAEPEQPGIRKETAEREAASLAAIPTEYAETGEPTELTYRADTEQPGIQPGEPHDTKQPAPQTVIGREAGEAAQTKTRTAAQAAVQTAFTETGEPAARTDRTDTEHPKTRTGEPIDMTETGTPAAVPTAFAETGEAAELTYREEPEQPGIRKETAEREAATLAAIPTEYAETGKPTELTYRADTEQPGTQPGEPHDTKQSAPQTVIGREAGEAAQTKTRTASQAAVQTAFTETGEPAARTDRTDTEHPKIRTGEPIDMTETVTPAAVPTAFAETGEAAELIHREEPEQPDAQTGASGDTKKRAPQSASAAKERELQTADGIETTSSTQTETAARTAIPSAYGQTGEAAELTYREEPEQSGMRRETAEPQAAATATAVPSAVSETDIPAELTFIEEPERDAGHGASRQTVVTAQSRPQVHQRGETMRAEKAARQTVRDIRMTSEHARRHPDAARSGRQTAEQDAQNLQKPQTADRTALPVGDAVSTPKQPELFFAAPTVIGQPPEDPTAAASERPSQSDKTGALPTWAKELLEKSGVSSAEQQSAAFGWDPGSSRSQQVNWTAPMATPQQSAPNGRTELTFKEPREAEQGPARQPIDDAEIQRTADKVYKLIEERLRRELRRSGR